MSSFRVREEFPVVPFPARMLLSDNFFRTRWVGKGERRLKNIGLVLVWRPETSKEDLKVKALSLHRQLTVGCGSPHCSNMSCASNPAVAPRGSKAAMMHALNLLKENPDSPTCLDTDHSYVVILSLAEGETIRRLIHQKDSLKKVGLALFTIEGEMIDYTTRGRLPEPCGPDSVCPVFCMVYPRWFLCRLPLRSSAAASSTVKCSTPRQNCSC